MVDFEDVCGENNACALSGVACFFMGVTGAVVVVNSPLWCYFNIFKNFEKSSDSAIFCTNLDNDNMIYGTEENLLNTLDLVQQTFGDKMQFLCIENNCSVNLIGDDINGIVKKAGITCNIITLDSGGAKGDFYDGYNMAAQAFLQQNKFSVQEPIKYSVNLLGFSEGVGNLRNDFPELIELLKSFGITVNTCPGYKDSNNLAEFRRAELNLVIVESLGLKIAEFCEENYNMPYLVVGLPYGILGTISWLEEILTFFNINHLFKTKLSALKMSYSKLSADRLRKVRATWGELQFPTVVLGGVSSMIIPLGACIKNEWVDCVEIYGLIYDGIVSKNNEMNLINMKTESDEFKKILPQLKEGLLLASSNERVLLSNAKIYNVVCKNIMNPNFEECNLAGKPYVAFNGSLNLLEEIWNKYIVLKKKSLVV